MNQVLPGLWEIDEIGNTVHCYAFEWEEGITLIDTGMPKDAATIMDAIKAQGWPLHLVRRIIITHMDVDHAGSLLKLSRPHGRPWPVTPWKKSFWSIRHGGDPVRCCCVPCMPPSPCCPSFGSTRSFPTS
ncbi:MAG: MBL fold metallo-hydrolase [Caldilineaceae bacterium]